MLWDADEVSTKLVCVASVAVLEEESETEKFALLWGGISNLKYDTNRVRWCD